ncbi:MAG TPA: exodeoxyribonuclease V subunit alpha [Acidimicrobiales bacterium]|jgi:exodeoxyribonuclease V alpha subunit
MTPSSGLVDLDRFDTHRALHAPGLLRDFNDAGVLIAADIHVALRLGRLGGDGDEAVLLAAALAVRGPRLGHVCTELATIRDTVSIDDDLPIDLQGLPWPDGEEWMERLSASPLVAVGGGGPDGHPLRLIGTSLYLDRYWQEECQVAADLMARADPGAPGVDLDRLRAGLDRLFDGEDPYYQRLAAASAVLRRFTVVAGGPGTGKTTTVARILALLDEQAEATGSLPPLVALAAPTGKAASRLQESVHAEASRLAVSQAIRARLLALNASTLHRLLGWRPDSRSRFRHHRGNRLPHDVVVVDETSMVSLSLMARLVEAVRPDARLVLVGDPGQLASVEAGAVLGDIVGPAAGGLLMRSSARSLLAAATGQAVPVEGGPEPSGVGDGIVVLRRIHRFGGQIAALAEAVGRGDADAALAVLGEGTADVRWIPADVAQPGPSSALAPVRRAIVDAGRRVFAAAHAGDGHGALDALGSFRVLCAHRRGEYGAATWMARVEEWLGAAIDGFAAEGTWYVGRPVLVTENDYGLKLYNGDTGVIVAGRAGHPVAVFERGTELLEFSPTRLAAVDTVYAMTVHKSQGSQFDGVAVLLPDPASPILTRELLYTAITRARRQLLLIGTEAAVRAALRHPIGRASGLRRRLWEHDEATGAGE